MQSTHPAAAPRVVLTATRDATSPRAAEWILRVDPGLNLSQWKKQYEYDVSFRKHARDNGRKIDDDVMGQNMNTMGVSLSAGEKVGVVDWLPMDQ